jgi:hypothetical protein
MTHFVKSFASKDARAIEPQALHDEAMAEAEIFIKMSLADPPYAPKPNRFSKPASFSETEMGGLTSNRFQCFYIMSPSNLSPSEFKYRALSGVVAIDRFRQDLRKIAARNKIFARNLLAGKLLRGAWYYKSRGDSDMMVVTKTVLFDGMFCEFCKEISESKDIISHKLQNSCFDKWQPPEGYIRMDQYHTSYRVMIEAGIPYVLGPTQWGAYIPGWVATALDKYSENGGYAGLSEADYLRRLAPGSNDDGTPTAV